MLPIVSISHFGNHPVSSNMLLISGWEILDSCWSFGIVELLKPPVEIFKEEIVKRIFKFFPTSFSKSFTRLVCSI